MITLYNAVSSDGYIAEKDGSEDFIPDALWPLTLSVLRGYDVLLMGRKTYEALQTYDKPLLEQLERLPIQKAVVSRSPLTVKEGYVAVPTPDAALALGGRVVASSGPSLNNYLLENKLVDRVVLHQLPASIGEGMPAFDTHYRAQFQLESESDLGLAKEVIYRIRK